MRKILLSIVLGLMISLTALNAYGAAEPAYVKWGKIAMTETGKRYQASIIDYKHLGRTRINEQMSEEKFKLWLKDSNKEFGVYVTIKFKSETEEIVSIVFRETN